MDIRDNRFNAVSVMEFAFFLFAPPFSGERGGLMT